ncbi:MAG: sodium:glutamate symporter [Kiritimatiellae bacterium]|nr:sodium:glutamate symporter [Kiritimatiellia bacterium]
MNAVYAFAALCGLLVAGKLLRINSRFLQRLYLPSSVVGGLVGLVLFSLLRDVVDPDFMARVRKVPEFMINVVFATLFLGAAVPRFRDVVRVAFPQFCLGQIMAWGQYAVGLGLSGFVLSRIFDVPAAFGNLLEIGFEGGHGTVGGMKASFDAYWPVGFDLGITVATAGMLIGIVAGMALVNWAHAKGIVKEVRSFAERQEAERRGLHYRRTRPSAGVQTVRSDSIDSLAWHVSIVGVSVAIGAGLLHLLQLTGFKVFFGFPLFPLCMIGGILLQLAVGACGRDLLVDRVQMERISGASLDFLVVAAVSTIRLEVVAANWLPLLALVVCGGAWSVFVVLWFGPRLFKEAWFERSIADFGQATGVTATGLMLLRTVDPENRTCAAASFGYKQLLHEPIMGGGLWTALAFTLVFQIGWFRVFAISLAMLVLWVVVGLVTCRRAG